MNLLAPAKDAVARHPVAAFLLVGIGVYVAAVLIPPLVETEILPFDLPFYGVLGGIFGVGLAAFVVTAATDGRAGVEDLARRSLRWRVPVRWYLIALFGVPVGATLFAIAIFHASFDASISELSYDIVPGSNAARFIVLSSVVILAATAVIVATKGQFAEEHPTSN